MALYYICYYNNNKLFVTRKLGSVYGLQILSALFDSRSFHFLLSNKITNKKWWCVELREDPFDHTRDVKYAF